MVQGHRAVPAGGRCRAPRQARPAQGCAPGPRACAAASVHNTTFACISGMSKFRRTRTCSALAPLALRLGILWPTPSWARNTAHTAALAPAPRCCLRRPRRRCVWPARVGARRRRAAAAGVGRTPGRHADRPLLPGRPRNAARGDGDGGGRAERGVPAGLSTPAVSLGPRRLGSSLIQSL